MLVVLVAVAAVSLAQSARDFERRDRPARTPPRTWRRTRSCGTVPDVALAAAPPWHVAESVRTVSGSTGVLLTDAEGSRWCRRTRRWSAGGSPSTAASSRRSWTGTQQDGDRALVVAQVPVYD